MTIHPDFPQSPYSILDPDIRWFPADEALGESSYDKLLPPLVHVLRKKVKHGERDIKSKHGRTAVMTVQAIQANHCLTGGSKPNICCQKPMELPFRSSIISPSVKRLRLLFISMMWFR